jgi:DNA-binding response OmpR family regulator
VRAKVLGDRRRSLPRTAQGTRSPRIEAPRPTGRVVAEAVARDRKRVLVADDEVDIANLVSCVLEDAGFDVHSVHSGMDALETALRERPDLVVLDVMMPGLDGREVSRRLKASVQTSMIPVVLFSAASVDLATTTADAFLAKPFDVDVLVAHAARLTSTA